MTNCMLDICLIVGNDDNQTGAVFTHLHQLVLGQGLVVTCLELAFGVTESAMMEVVTLHRPVVVVHYRYVFTKVRTKYLAIFEVAWDFHFLI